MSAIYCLRQRVFSICLPCRQITAQTKLPADGSFMLFTVWAVAYAQSANCAAADVFVFPFHKLAAFCRIEKTFAVC